MDRSWPARPPLISDGVLTLRLWTAEDVDQVYNACQDREIQRWTAIPSPYELSDARFFVTELVPQQWHDQSGAHFAVVSDDDGTLLGACGITTSADSAHRAELGYWVVSNARGRKIAQRAARLLSQWALSSGGFAELELFVEIGNEASSRAALGAGFEYDRVVEGRVVRHGRPRDMWRYTLSVYP